MPGSRRSCRAARPSSGSTSRCSSPGTAADASRSATAARSSRWRARSASTSPRFEEGLDDPGLLENIARDHVEAVEEHGVFGTPTFLFENGTSAYLKAFIPPEDDSVDFFDHFVALFADRAYVGEIKRPQPPWPKGAV